MTRAEALQKVLDAYNEGAQEALDSSLAMLGGLGADEDELLAAARWFEQEAAKERAKLLHDVATWLDRGLAPLH